MAGLYIHIPFCASRCVYCDFFSSTDFSFKRGYIDAVCRELELRIHELRDKPVFTVYLGGGTPSSLSPSERGRLFRTLSTVVDWSICKEVTLEVNLVGSEMCIRDRCDTSFYKSIKGYSG